MSTSLRSRIASTPGRPSRGAQAWLLFSLAAVTASTLLMYSPNAARATHLVQASSADPFMRSMAEGRITRGHTRHRMIHFTFDDGPRLDTTPILLRHLDEAGIKATFFVVGRQVEANTEVHRRKAALVREMIADGHTIAAHSYDHSSFTSLSDEEIEEQLLRTEKIFTEEFGARPWLFRPPYGRRDERTDAILASRGYTQLLWNITGRDISSRSAGEVVTAFRSSLNHREASRRGHGGIVLLHDTKRWVVDAFPYLLQELRRRNCGLLERDEETELWDIVNDPRIFHQSRADDPSRFARTVELPPTVIEARQRMVRERAVEHCEAFEQTDALTASL